MAKTLIWPFRNGQAISKPLKSFKMAKGFETASNTNTTEMFGIYLSQLLAYLFKTLSRTCALGK